MIQDKKPKNVSLSTVSRKKLRTIIKKLLKKGEFSEEERLIISLIEEDKK